MIGLTEQDSAIDALFAEWRAAYQRKDVDAILALLTQDYLLWAPAAEPIGIDGLKPRLAAALAAFDVEPSYDREERIVSGDLAFERGWDVQHVIPRNGGDVINQRQRVFMILRRDPDGRWRFARGMSQSGPSA
jgi:ketosteroid isomerase-like protein